MNRWGGRGKSLTERGEEWGVERERRRGGQGGEERSGE